MSMAALRPLPYTVLGKAEQQKFTAAKKYLQRLNYWEKFHNFFCISTVEMLENSLGEAIFQDISDIQRYLKSLDRQSRERGGGGPVNY
jgi:hypothetical protein